MGLVSDRAMNAERLLAQFERISEAPDAIPRLRRFILDLAVRGKLVKQDPEDETAGDLLNRVSADISDYQQTFNIRTHKQKRDFSTRLLFRLPTGWQWTRLSDVFRSITDGDHQAPPRTDEGVPFLVISDVRSGVINYNGSRSVPASYYEGLDCARRPAIGDLLYTLVGSFGIPVVVREAQPFCVQRHIGILRPSGLIPVEFLALLMDSMLVYKQVSEIATGIAQKTVPLGGLRSVLIPLPPLAEQHRIVAKVDELMALCDQLEAARQKREQGHERLVAATLQRLNQPAEDPASFRQDASFALQVLPNLTATPAQIKQLRQTILNLAVRGKLVEQDPEDEPAEELKRRISAEKTPAGRRKKALTPIEESEKYLEIPLSWAWVRLLELGHTQTGTSPSSANPELFGDEIPFIKPGNLDGKQIFYYGPGLSLEGVKQSRLAPSNTVLMVCIGATLGKVNTTTRPVCFNQQINSLSPVAGAFTDYLALAFKSSGFQKLVWSKAGTGTLPIISKGKWEILPVPLPPLAEQHRIVAKVDELMALCDQLEQQLSQADQQRRRLLEAVLAEALVEPEKALGAAYA
jgi:type I restriction enzyme, S subunit